MDQSKGPDPEDPLRPMLLPPTRPPRHLAALLFALLALFAGCDGQTPAEPGKPEHAAEPLTRVLLIGVDGLEWSVLQPLLAAGRCPNLLGLMERGSFGKLGTFRPTWSPVIWTSIATGKSMKQHGITGFVDEQQREFTSTRRRGRALWNIADMYGLSSNVFGWWITWPVEPVRGVMVSATSAAAMIDKNWKPALMEGLPDQVYPPALEGRVMAVARQAGAEEHVMAVARDKVFGSLPTGDMEPVERDLVSQTLWSIQSDETFLDVAVDLLPDHPADLSLVYLGGTDVVGHRFWRHMQPELYDWHGSSPELDAAFAEVIPNYYVWADEMLGQLLAAAGDDVTVLVVSDHGMHEVSLKQPNARRTTGDHQDGAPGVIIAAGPGIAVQGGVQRFLKNGFLSTLGSVMDLAPTVLGLLGVPPARDMAGRVNRVLLDAPTRQAVADLGMVDTHDEGFREPSLIEVPPEKAGDFLDRFGALGYLDGLEGAPDDSIPVNPETFTPDPEAAAAGSSDGR